MSNKRWTPFGPWPRKRHQHGPTGPGLGDRQARRLCHCRSPQCRQATDNANAADVSLTEAELEEMDRISRPVTDLIDENPVQWKW
jgi:hypothetical protein